MMFDPTQCAPQQEQDNNCDMMDVQQGRETISLQDGLNMMPLDMNSGRDTSMSEYVCGRMTSTASVHSNGSSLTGELGPTNTQFGAINDDSGKVQLSLSQTISTSSTQSSPSISLSNLIDVSTPEGAQAAAQLQQLLNQQAVASAVGTPTASASSKKRKRRKAAAAAAKMVNPDAKVISLSDSLGNDRLSDATIRTTTTSNASRDTGISVSSIEQVSKGSKESDRVLSWPPPLDANGKSRATNLFKQVQQQQKVSGPTPTANAISVENQSLANRVQALEKELRDTQRLLIAQGNSLKSQSEAVAILSRRLTEMEQRDYQHSSSSSHVPAVINQNPVITAPAPITAPPTIRTATIRASNRTITMKQVKKNNEKKTPTVRITAFGSPTSSGEA